MVDLTAELKKAMKEKNKTVKSAIVDLKGRIKNFKIEKGIDEITDDQFISLVKKAKKVSLEIIEWKTKVIEGEPGFNPGQKQDIVWEQEKIAYLDNFLPEEISEENLKSIVEQVIGETSATSMRDMGKVMGGVKKIVADSGKDLDGSLLSKIVKTILS
jgi:uncharacterized protein YqeY